ncbi:MAG: serine/threonine protein kinase [Rhodothermales bacterium]|nr:serine/threonine protein kinase [Rhodothermales bacterium]
MAHAAGIPKVSRLRARQRIGKYRIEKRLGEGGFAGVYQAYDTIEGVRVALKVPHAPYVNDDVLKDFRSEFRSSSRLRHDNILAVKDASIVQDRLIIAMPLGIESLGDRMKRRMSTRRTLHYIEQLLDAVAHAHENDIVHCDIKPENLILFPDDELRLTDFGVAKVSQKTLSNSIRGTVGHMAPEQAMGRATYQSDVFAIGLTSYRLLTGEWPEWPFTWPLPGHKKLRRRVHPKFVAWLKRALQANPKKRFRDAVQMRDAYVRIAPTIARHLDSR